MYINTIKIYIYFDKCVTNFIVKLYYALKIYATFMFTYYQIRYHYLDSETDLSSMFLTPIKGKSSYSEPCLYI